MFSFDDVFLYDHLTILYYSIVTGKFLDMKAAAALINYTNILIENDLEKKKKKTYSRLSDNAQIA